MFFCKGQCFVVIFAKKHGAYRENALRYAPIFYIFLILWTMIPPTAPMHTPATVPESISAGR